MMSSAHNAAYSKGPTPVDFLAALAGQLIGTSISPEMIVAVVVVVARGTAMLG